tara:strand:+ start:4919 stop:6172 length:1254 start_codon:yes stop_codon:yes gene_type:complete
MSKTKSTKKVEEPKKVEEKTEVKTNETPKQEGEFKLKKPKQLGEEKPIPDLVKVDLSKTKKEDAVQTQKTDDSDAVVEKPKDSSDSKEVVEEVRETKKVVESDSPIQEITDEEDNTDTTGVAGSNETTTTSSKQEEILQEAETQKLPENIEKLVKFMEETGGTVEDYARLNADYSKIDGNMLLHEYYKQAKPHLNMEERNFMIEDSFTYDEEVDEERDIKKKKLAYKEEIAKARNFLEGLKTKYYDEIKLRPGVTQEQKKATDFFNRYNEEQKARKVNHERFVSNTKNLLNEEFKGFDFKLGEKKFRYGIKDPSSIAQKQSDISNFIKTFLNDKGEITDTKGYHKALYAATNADTIANHFYEQGKTDAIKDQLAKSKNISTEPRKTAPGELFVGGLKVKAISGYDSSKLKIKKKTFN